MAVILAVTFIIIGLMLPIKPTAVVDAPPIHCQLPNTFSLKWRHSVEKQYWQEVYQLDYPNLILTKTYLQTFGAGTPNLGKPVRAPKGYLGQIVNQHLGELNWLVSHNIQAKIAMGDTLDAHPVMMPIHQMVADHSVVNIHPMRLTAWQYIRLPTCQAVIHGQSTQ